MVIRQELKHLGSTDKSALSNFVKTKSKLMFNISGPTIQLGKEMLFFNL
jgi:hypothetical protein